MDNRILDRMLYRIVNTFELDRTGEPEPGRSRGVPREWQPALDYIFSTARAQIDRSASHQHDVWRACERAVDGQRARALLSKLSIAMPPSGSRLPARMRKRLERIARLIIQFGENYDEVSDAAMSARCIVDESDWSDRYFELAFAESILSKAHDAKRFLAWKPEKTDSHRPRGSTSSPVFRRLVLDLYRSIVGGAHGQLTLRKERRDGATKGTLPTVLRYLRPSLPDIIPAALPYESLRDMRKLARDQLGQ